MAASTPIFLNNVASTISAVASGATTTVTVASGDGAKFGTITPGQYIPVVIVDPSTSPETVKEYMWVTGVAGDVLTVTRAAESAATYPAGALAAGLTIAAVASAAALGPAYTVASGCWWHVVVGPVANFVTVLNVMYLFPADMPAAQTWQGRTADIAAAGTTGAVLRAGFYGSDSHGQPDLTNLIADIGTVASTSAGLVTWSGLSVALPKGRVWMALVAQTAVCTVRGLTTGAPIPFSLPSGTSPSSNVPAQMLAVAGVSGALPTSGTIASNNGNQPKTWLQAA